jgi:hypothetical protein
VKSGLSRAGKPRLSPRRRRRRAGPLAHYGAPAAFLLAATVAILLIHAGLGGRTTPAPGTIARSTPVAPTTTAATPRKRTPKPSARYYVIEGGDSFGVVAAKLHTTVQQLEALNPGVSSNALHVGQRIRVG